MTHSLLNPSDTFIHRHIGPSDAEIQAMLDALGIASLDELADQTIPGDIHIQEDLDLGEARGEFELLEELRGIAGQNRLLRSLIGTGYYDCIIPPVIQRNILENPGWYTQYTPYQAEISQGRLEALLNFQTLVTDSGSESFYAPGGVRASVQQLIDQQGLVQGTTSGLDVAISGDGFFVVEGKGDVLELHSLHDRYRQKYGLSKHEFPLLELNPIRWNAPFRAYK